jgi:uncharacterized protein YdaT
LQEINFFETKPRRSGLSYKGEIMPWYNGDYPPSYKNQPKYLREKAVEIANEVLKSTGNEGEAIATGLKRAREHFEEHPEEKEENKDES